MKFAKRILLIALTAVLSFGVANAEFRFGVRAGMNVNKLSSNIETFMDKENSCGWNAGLTVEYTVPIIGIGVDASVLYSRMNNAVSDKVYDISYSDGLTKDEGNLYGKNFIEIPINIKYKFNIPAVASIIKPYIFTGPSFALKLDKNILDSYKTKTCQVAWNVGLGLELIRHLQVSASYGFGINNIASGWVQATDLKVRNNYWTIGVGYLF